MKKKISVMLTCMCLFASYSTVNAATADDRDCGEFASREEIMQFWYDNGYSASNDPHDLDGDSDGLACEVSDSEYAEFVASQETGTEQPPSTESDDAPAEAGQGEQMPDTASNSLLMALLSAGFAGIGSLLIFSRKKKQV